MTDRKIAVNTALKNTEIVKKNSYSVPVSALVFTGLSVPVWPWLCFSGSGRSLELFAPGSRTAVRGSGCCLESPEHGEAANPTGLQEERRREPCSLYNDWCIVSGHSLAGRLTAWDALKEGDRKGRR